MLLSLLEDAAVVAPPEVRPPALYELLPPGTVPDMPVVGAATDPDSGLLKIEPIPEVPFPALILDEVVVEVAFA